MADRQIKVSELQSSGTNTDGLWALGVDKQGNSVKIPIGEILARIPDSGAGIKDVRIETLEPGENAEAWMEDDTLVLGIPKGEKGDDGERGETGAEGKSAYQVWLDEGNVGSEVDFLNSLKAHIGGFKPVAYDSNATQTVGGAASAIDGLSPSADTMDLIVLMPNSGGTATIMYSTTATESGGETTYSFVCLGTLSIDTNNFLSSSNVDSTNLNNPTSSQVAKAIDVMELKAKLAGVTATEDKVALVQNTNWFDGYYISPSTGKVTTTSSGNPTNGVLCVPVTGKTAVRFLGFRKASTGSGGSAYGFATAQLTSQNISDYTLSEWKEYGNGATNDMADEYVIPVPEGMDYFVCTIRKYNNNNNAAMTIDTFYCYLQSGDSVGESIVKKIEINKVPVADYSQYIINDPTHYIADDGLLHSGTYGNAGYTDFIPIDEVKGLICSAPFSKSTGSTSFYGLYVYDSSKTKMREIGYKSSPKSAMWYVKQSSNQYNDAYVRFNLGTDAEIKELTLYDAIIPSDISNYEALKISAGAKIGNTAIFVKKTGKNILSTSNIVIETGLYVYHSSGNLSYSASSTSVKGVTGFIQMMGNAVVCNAMYTSGNGGWACYDENYHYTHGGQGAYANYVPGDVFVRFTLSAATNIQVEYGKISTEYEPYSATYELNNELFPANGGGSGSIPTISIPSGNNLCNPADVKDDYYINANNGNEVSNTGRSVTGFIPIDESGVVCDVAVQPSGNYIGWAYYKADTTFLAAGYSNNAKAVNGSTFRYAAYMKGAAYVRFTVPKGSDIMVNKGAYILPYEEYQGVKNVIENNLLPDKPDYQQGLRIVLPSNIYIPNNGNGFDDVRLYWRSILTAANPDCFDCAAVNGASNDNNYVANFRSRYVKIVKSNQTAGTNTMVLAARGNDGSLLATKKVYVRHISRPSNPATEKHILLIGASRHAGGETVKEMIDRINLSNVSLVGRRSSIVDGVTVYHEAVAGAQIAYLRAVSSTVFYFYLAQNSGIEIPVNGTILTDETTSIEFKVVGGEAPTTTKSGNLQCKLVTSSDDGNFPVETTSGTLSNTGESLSIEYTGFVRSNSNYFYYNGNPTNFSYYSTQYCSSKTIDILILSRGANDLANLTPVSDIVENYKDIIDSFHTYNSGGKVIINLEPMTNPYYDGYRPDNFYSSFMTSARAFWSLQERLIALAESDDYNGFVVLANTSAEFDLENLYGASNKSTGRRGSATEKAGGDYIHYTDDGKLAVADSLYHAVAKCLNDMSNAE